MADPRQSFGPVAERYATSAVHGNPVALQRLIELVAPAGGRVLDVACGSGHAGIAFAPFVDAVIASDMTAQMAEVCRSQAAAKGIGNLSAVVGRAEALPFPESAFDGVVCRIAPHHFDHPPTFIGEVKRVLRPGGWFLLIDNVGPEDPAAAHALDAIERDRDPSHRSYLSVAIWRGLLQDSRFAIRHEEGVEKPIDIEDWLERMAVPDSARSGIRERIQNVSGALRDYLQPTSQAFLLREHLFLADNPQ